MPNHEQIRGKCTFTKQVCGTRATAQSQQPLCEKPGRRALHSPAQSVEQGKTRPPVKRPSALWTEVWKTKTYRGICLDCSAAAVSVIRNTSNYPSLIQIIFMARQDFLRYSDRLWMILHTLASYTLLNSNNYTTVTKQSFLIASKHTMQ